MYDKICKQCGWPLSEFYRTGMLGCPHCYKAFEREIVPTLYKIQGKTLHTGKTPYNLSKEDRELLEEYKKLIFEKELATIEGRFTDIRKLAEQIVRLSSELKNRGLL